MPNERFENELERLMADKLDGDLAPADARRLDEMLDRDPQAKKEADALERVDELIRSSGKTMPAMDWSRFRAELMSDVRREAARKSRMTYIFRIGAAAVPLAAAAVLAFMFWPRTQLPPSAQPGMLPAAAVKPVMEVAYRRVGDVAPQRTQSKVAVEFHRSEELARSTAERDAANQAQPEYAVAAGSGNEPANVSLELDLPPI